MATFQKYHAIKLSFINKNLLKTCFDHNFSRSSPIRPSFCTLPELILLSTKQTLNPRQNALSGKKNYRAEPSPRALENSNSLRETKKGRKSAHLSNHVSPLQTSPTQKRKNGPSTTLQTVENGTLVGVLAAHMAANDRRQVGLVFSKGKWPKISRFSTNHFSADFIDAHPTKSRCFHEKKQFPRASAKIPSFSSIWRDAR